MTGARKWNFSLAAGESLASDHPMPDLRDDNLLQRISKGDEAAFLAFYRQYQGPVYRFAMQMSGKTELAEEVTQDVFMAAMRAAGEYNASKGSPVAFLYGIARNYVMRCLERERQYVALLSDADSDQADLPSLEQSALDGLTKTERVESLRKAVLALPPAYREAVVLCDLEELDYTAAAEALGCAVGTVRSRLHRARALLAEKLRAGERCTA